MIPFLSFLTVLGLVSLTYQFLPVVTVLPMGMDAALIFFVSTIKSLIALLPFLEVVWNLFLWGISIQVLITTFEWSMMFINLFAKSGASAPR